MKRVLGFDVSSSTIGICVLDIDDGYNITPSLITYYKPPHNENILDDLFETKQYITNLIKEIGPTHIAIEQIIPYMKGSSTATTIIKLASFNRMIGLLAYEFLGSAPQMCYVQSIRHGLKHTKKLPEKEDMPKVVSKHLNIKFPYIYKQYKKKTNKKTIAPETYDQADAVAVALYYSHILIGKINKK